MAKHTFLTEEDLVSARKNLLRPLNFVKEAGLRQEEISKFLNQRLLQRLEKINAQNPARGWLASGPIALGSWARGEICAKSDIDLLFVGDEEAVKDWMAQAQSAGLKVRARVPQDMNDWSKGVEPFDVLALLTAKYFSPATEVPLRLQQNILAKKWKSAMLKAIKRERAERRERLDGIANYLEPNIKFGTGGLRDIDQALAIAPLFPQKFLKGDGYSAKVLTEIKSELLMIRQWLHLNGRGDILSAADQLEMWQPFGFSSHKEFMRHLQNQLERASFYADWVVARCLAATKQGAGLQNFNSIDSALQALRKSPDSLTQYEVRRQIPKLAKSVGAEKWGLLLQKAIKAECKDDFLIALYRTRFLESVLPGYKVIKGLVQHDHYHRFTVDAHLLQALRETQRFESKSSTLGPLRVVARRLSEKDWFVLKLTALFHDLAKGREGDHSTEGAKWVDKVFKDWGYPTSLKEDVQWLVLNHLILSTAAFRRNPKEKSTWKMLMDRGVTGRRLDLLTIFTAIDIRATNPEAWNPWKAQLIADLNLNMHSKPVQKLEQLIQQVPPKQTKLKEALLKLDPQVVEHISSKVLVSDIQEILKVTGKGLVSLPPKVVKAQKNQVWVRFHASQDAPGLFLNYVQRLFGYGLGVQVAAVMTLDEVGVYDWFLVKTRSEVKNISKWLSLKESQCPAIPRVNFQSIELISEDEESWILSFRGKDQKGLLVAAAHKLYDLGLSIRWAQVHTWGQQIDDVFCVSKGGDISHVLQTLRQHFTKTS